MVAETFLETVTKGLQHLEWSSAPAIAEYTGLALGDVVSALNELKLSGKVGTRIRGKGLQYGLNVAAPSKKVDDDITEKIEFDFDNVPNGTLDEFMFLGLKKIPKDKDFSAYDLADILLANSSTKWTKDDVVQNIAKMVRMNKLTLRPFIDYSDNKLKYNYIVS